jgi:hypothetical protein
MKLYIRYQAQRPDEELDEIILGVFQDLGFEVTFAGQDISEGSRDIWFNRTDPFDDISDTLH